MFSSDWFWFFLCKEPCFAALYMNSGLTETIRSGPHSSTPCSALQYTEWQWRFVDRRATESWFLFQGAICNTERKCYHLVFCTRLGLKMVLVFSCCHSETEFSGHIIQRELKCSLTGILSLVPMCVGSPVTYMLCISVQVHINTFALFTPSEVTRRGELQASEEARVLCYSL